MDSNQSMLQLPKPPRWVATWSRVRSALNRTWGKVVTPFAGAVAVTVRTPHRIPQGLFVSIGMVVLSTSILMAIFKPPLQFSSPDTSMGWIALCLSLVVLCQQITNLRGFSYIFGIKDKDSYDSNYNQAGENRASILGRFKMILRSLHWVAMAFLVFFLVMLVRSTFWPMGGGSVTRQDIRELQDGQQALMNSQQQTNEKIQALIDRIDKLLEQRSSANTAIPTIGTGGEQ